MAHQQTSKFLELPAEIRAMIYGYCLPHNNRISFNKQSPWVPRGRYDLPLALRPRLEYKEYLALLGVSKQTRRDARNFFFPHVTPVLQAMFNDPSHLKVDQRGLLGAVRCLEVHVIGSVVEACSILAKLPSTVEHLRFHFDWRQSRLQGSAVAWIDSFADLLVYKFHPQYKSIGADLYLERFLKTTELDQQLARTGMPHHTLCNIYFCAERRAIERASMQTLHFPAQLKSLAIVAPFSQLDVDWTIDPFFGRRPESDPPVKYDVVSTEKDWLQDDAGRSQLLRHKQAILSPGANGLAGNGQQIEIKETFINRSDSVFRNQDWDGLGDLEPTRDTVELEQPSQVYYVT